MQQYTHTIPGCSSDTCVEACEENWERNGDHCYLWPASTASTAFTTSGDDYDYVDVRRQYQDYGYGWSNTKMSWDDAEGFCQAAGGHLASVGSSATKDYLTKGMTERGHDEAFFGGNDREEEGTWKWADCAPWDFTFWNPGEPNNGGGVQNCLSHDLPKWGWDDDTCSNEKWFVCSKKICPGNVENNLLLQSFKVTSFNKTIVTLEFFIFFQTITSDCCLVRK